MTRREEAIEKAALSLGEASASYGGDQPGMSEHRYRAHHAIAAYEAHMRPEITSVEEAERLPNGTIIEDGGDILEKFAFDDGYTYWNHFGADSPSRSHDLVFPARVIHWGQP